MRLFEVCFPVSADLYPKLALSVDEISCEIVLSAWGAYQRAELEQEVGYPSVVPPFIDYESPRQCSASSAVSQQDIERACWAMVVLSSRQRSLWRDLRDHYRDGMKLGWNRLSAGRNAFSLVWAEWDSASSPAGSH